MSSDERRRNNLTEEDLINIEEAFARRLVGFMEMIGLDTSTAEARRALNEDHI